MATITEEILSKIPHDAKISSTKYEGANIILYTKSKRFFKYGGDIIYKLVEDFKKRILGRTGLRVGRLGVAASYGAPAEAFEEAFEKGCNYFYCGSGRHRANMRQAIRNICSRGQRDKLSPNQGVGPPALDQERAQRVRTRSFGTRATREPSAWPSASSAIASAQSSAVQNMQVISPQA